MRTFPVHADPASSTPASLELIAMAHKLVRQHPECFWFRHPEARIRYLEDIRLVVDHLREYGNCTAWREAQVLQKCLSQHSRSVF